MYQHNISYFRFDGAHLQNTLVILNDENCDLGVPNEQSSSQQISELLQLYKAYNIANVFILSWPFLVWLILHLQTDSYYFGIVWLRVD